MSNRVNAAAARQHALAARGRVYSSPLWFPSPPMRATRTEKRRRLGRRPPHPDPAGEGKSSLVSRHDGRHRARHRDPTGSCSAVLPACALLTVAAAVVARGPVPDNLLRMSLLDMPAVVVAGAVVGIDAVLASGIAIRTPVTGRIGSPVIRWMAVMVIGGDRSGHIRRSTFQGAVLPRLRRHELPAVAAFPSTRTGSTLDHVVACVHFPRKSRRRIRIHVRLRISPAHPLMPCGFLAQRVRPPMANTWCTSAMCAGTLPEQGGKKRLGPMVPGAL